MLKAIMTKIEDNECIGRPVVSQDGQRGWIETIFLYTNNIERWRVVGDKIDNVTESSDFEFISGEKKYFRIWDGEASSAMRRDLPKEEISRLLMEALALKKRYIAGGQRDGDMFRLMHAIETYLSDDVISIACTSQINHAYVDLQQIWDNEDQWQQVSQQIAKKIIDLRKRDKREQARKR